MAWMAWTFPTAVFFIAIGVLLAGMTGLQFVWPTVERKGFLPMRTTRGDRVFIGLLSGAFIHLAWAMLITAVSAPLWGASIVALLWFAVLMRWG